MFQRIIQKLKKVKIKDVAQSAIGELSDEIEEMNRQQLWSGLDSSGNSLDPEYAESTIKRKKSKGQPTDRVTLKDSGQFHESITAKALKGAIMITSNRKAGSYDLAQHLEDVYGDKASLFGLTEDNREELKKKLIPIFQKQILNHVAKS